MGKPKEKPKKPWRKPEEVAPAKPLVTKLAKAKVRLGKVKDKIGADASKSDPRHRAARKRVKRAQRRLREVLKYDAQRAKAKPAAEAAAPATPAAPAPPAAEAPAS